MGCDGRCSGDVCVLGWILIMVWFGVASFSDNFRPSAYVK